MRFETLEELLGAWWQAEADDDERLFFVLWADGTDGGGLSEFGQWEPDRRRWASMSLAEALQEVWQDLASPRHGRVKSLANVQQRLSQYELKETRG